MTHDVQVLRTWIQICLIIAAVCTTVFPLLFACSPWYKSSLGRAIMLRSVAFALIIDLTAVFQFWQTDNIMLLFWVNAVSFSLVTIASIILTWQLWERNYRNPNRRKDRKWLTRRQQKPPKIRF